MTSSPPPAAVTGRWGHGDRGEGEEGNGTKGTCHLFCKQKQMSEAVSCFHQAAQMLVVTFQRLECFLCLLGRVMNLVTMDTHGSETGSISFTRQMELSVGF